MRATLLEFAMVTCCAMIAIREFSRRRDCATEDAIRKKYALFVLLGWIVIGGQLILAGLSIGKFYPKPPNGNQQHNARELPLENVIRDSLREQHQN